MLVPTGLSKKERKAYDEIHTPTIPSKINVGPKGGLRPVGGVKKAAPKPEPKPEKKSAKTTGKEQHPRK